MKRLLLVSLIIAGCFIATTGNAQVYVQAKVSFGAPVAHVYYPPPPPVVVYSAPRPPVYYDQSCERPVVVRRGYEKVRYYDNSYQRNDQYCDRDDRGYRDDRNNGHGRKWKKQRNW